MSLLNVDHDRTKPLVDFGEKAVGLSAEDLIREASRVFGDGLVMSTSFGAHSAVMLDLVTRIVPDIPVIWIDTGYLFPETYRFGHELTRRLDLNLHVFQPDLSPARMEALFGPLWRAEEAESLERYDRLRKVEPMRRALRDLKARAWLSGLRREQTAHRSQLSRVHLSWGVHKVLPILEWDKARVESYLRKRELPFHPLCRKGYVSIGDWHSSRPMSAEDRQERDTRYRGIKQECGLHLDLSEEAAESLDSSQL